jgi:hypothetical protein
VFHCGSEWFITSKEDLTNSGFVIPAKVGIHEFKLLVFRLRGNDRCGNEGSVSEPVSDADESGREKFVRACSTITARLLYMRRQKRKSISLHLQVE